MLSLREYVSMKFTDIMNLMDDDFERYKYATALRGFDYSTEILKTIFTGFIRGRSVISKNVHVNVVDFVELFMKVDADEITNELTYELDDIVKEGRASEFAHWFGHVKLALHVLNKVTKMKIVDELLQLSYTIDKYVFQNKPVVTEIRSRISVIAEMVRKEMT